MFLVGGGDRDRCGVVGGSSEGEMRRRTAREGDRVSYNFDVGEGAGLGTTVTLIF